MKPVLKPRFTQAHMNKLVKQMFKSYKEYHAKVSEYSRKGKDIDLIPAPVYTANEDLNAVLIACMIHVEEVELFAKKNDKKWDGKLKALTDVYIEEMFTLVGTENAKANASLFILNGSNPSVDVDDLGDDHDDE